MAHHQDIQGLRTEDGVDSAAHRRGPADAPVALVLAHGFSMNSSDRRLTALAGGLAGAGRAVYTFDFRGHGRSAGISTLGDLEILDLDVVVKAARANTHDKVVVIGASLGGFVSLRHAALIGGEDAVVGISTPATWGVSPRFRAQVLKMAVASRAGRRLLSARGTRVLGQVPVPPMSPSELAPRISIPVALIHGDRDHYVPAEDSVLLHERLGGPKRLVILPGFGHAETAYSPQFATVLDSLVDELLGGTSRPSSLSP